MGNMITCLEFGESGDFFEVLVKVSVFFKRHYHEEVKTTLISMHQLYNEPIKNQIIIINE